MKRTQLIQFKTTPEEKKIIVERAQSYGMSMAQYIRDTALYRSLDNHNYVSKNRLWLILRAAYAAELGTYDYKVIAQGIMDLLDR